MSNMKLSTPTICAQTCAGNVMWMLHSQFHAVWVDSDAPPRTSPHRQQGCARICAENVTWMQHAS